MTARDNELTGGAKLLWPLSPRGAPRLIGSALTSPAEIALFAGDFAAVARDARAAADVLAVAPPLRPAAMAVLTQAPLGLGQPEEALSPSPAGR